MVKTVVPSSTNIIMVGMVTDYKIVLPVDYFLESKTFLQLLALENNNMSTLSISVRPDISKKSRVCKIEPLTSHF